MPPSPNENDGDVYFGCCKHTNSTAVAGIGVRRLNNYYIRQQITDLDP